MLLLIGAPEHRARAGQDAQELLITGRVEHVHASRLFTISDDDTDRELLVFVPAAEATPLPGTRVVARGIFARCEDAAGADRTACDEVGDLTRAEHDSRLVFIAGLLATSTGHQLVSPIARGEGAALALAIRPGMLAYHIDTLAGQSVRVPYARVIGVFEPNVFLVDSQAQLAPLVGNRARVLVFIDGAKLRVAPALLVGSTVTISGVARTLLGMQVSREVPWPIVLTRHEVEHLEIKAAILAKSVKTPDGIELTDRASPASTNGRSRMPALSSAGRRQ